LENLKGRPRPACEDNTVFDLTKIKCYDVEWLQLALDRDQWWVLVNMVMNLKVTQKAKEFLAQLSHYQLLKK
jgi:hypothetical protein